MQELGGLGCSSNSEKIEQLWPFLVQSQGRASLFDVSDNFWFAVVVKERPHLLRIFIE